MLNLEDFLCRPIAFNRAFVTLTGSINAALMLSQSVYWSKRSTIKDGWFYKTQQEWEEETGLTRYEQETARKVLRGITNIWFEEKRGVPAKLFFKVDMKALLRCFVQDAENQHTEAFSLQETSTPVCGNPATIPLSTKTTTENTHAEIIIEILNNTKKAYGIRGEVRFTKDRKVMIEARLKEWKSQDPIKDIRLMIDHRCKAWKGTEWEKFIRIETLFQPKKFFGYMEAAEAAPEKDWTEQNRIDDEMMDATAKHIGIW